MVRKSNHDLFPFLRTLWCARCSSSSEFEADSSHTISTITTTIDCAPNPSNVEASIRQTKSRIESSNLYTKYCHPFYDISLLLTFPSCRTALQGLWTLHVKTKKKYCAGRLNPDRDQSELMMNSAKKRKYPFRFLSKRARTFYQVRTRIQFAH